MSNKSHNILSGEGIDDMDYVEELGLDPALAYTPEINEANRGRANIAEYKKKNPNKGVQ